MGCRGEDRDRQRCVCVCVTPQANKNIKYLHSLLPQVIRVYEKEKNTQSNQLNESYVGMKHFNLMVAHNTVQGALTAPKVALQVMRKFSEITKLVVSCPCPSLSLGMEDREQEMRGGKPPCHS